MLTVTVINKTTKKRGWEYLKTWVGVFRVEIFWVGILQGEFDWWGFSGWEFS